MLNEETLEVHLHRDLDRVQPGTLPLDALIGRGRAIKRRRRAGVLAGLAAVAALAVGAPVVLSGGGSSAKPAAGPQRVLASGTADGKAWWFTAGDPKAASTIRCGGYVKGYWGTANVGTCLGALPVTTDPVSLFGSGLAGDMYFARLRPDVDHITLALTDGTVLTPAITQVSGIGYAFFVLPTETGIARLDAVGAGGKPIAYTLPYHRADSPSTQVEQWYAAGTTPTQAAVEQTLFSVPPSEATTPVTVAVDLGPFGVCYLVSAPPASDHLATAPGPDCHGLTPPAATDLSLLDHSYGDRELLLAEVNNAVDHVEITLSDAGTARLVPIRVGGHSFVATLLDPGVMLRGAKSFDASGHQLAVNNPNPTTP
jgi:hypothetical protein